MREAVASFQKIESEWALFWTSKNVAVLFMAERLVNMKVYYKNGPNGVKIIKYGIYLELIVEFL